MPSLSRFALVAASLAHNVLGARLFASHFSGKVYSLTFERDSAGKGTLSINSTTTDCGKLSSWLTLDQANGTLYCFDESYGAGVVSAFDVSGAAVERTGQASTGGNDVHGWLYGGADGKGFLATVEYAASSVSTYKLPLTATSRVLQKLSFTMSGRGPNSARQDAPHPHAAITDPTGRYLIVPDLGADLIRIFSINASTGKLTACPSAKAAAGDGPRHSAWWSPHADSNDGLTLFTINELSSSITGWQIVYPSASSGCLTLIKKQTLSTFASGSPPSPPSSQPVKAAEIHTRDNFLYASNRNDQLFGSKQDSLVTYNISSTGVLDFVEATNSHTWYPRTFSINKAGDLVAVGGQTSANLAIIARNPQTGRLGDLVATLDVGTPGRDGQEDGLSAVVWNWSSEKAL